MEQELHSAGCAQHTLERAAPHRITKKKNTKATGNRPSTLSLAHVPSSVVHT